MRGRFTFGRIPVGRIAFGRIAIVAAALLGQLFGATFASAHALDPVLFELRERADGNVDVLWKGPNAQIPGVKVVPVLPEVCRQIGEKSEELIEEAVESRWVLDCGGGLAGLTIGIDGLESTDALVRVSMLTGAVDRRVLGADHSSLTIDAAPTRLAVFVDYARLGMEHIATGIDHLLFVFGLLLLAGGWRAVLATVTAFTLGHSVTLALAALDVVSVPQAPVEVIIALTIYVLAVELARDGKTAPSWMRRWPWLMSFSFGLLHGLGFAGALREAGLPGGEVPMALFSFNLGIEAGQVAFVAVVLAAMSAFGNVLAAAPTWAARVPVYAMGTAASYWVLTRAVALF